MAKLTDLPRELRQKILLAAVQQEDRLVGSTWPQTITTLLRVCKTLRRDMPWVLNTWSPQRWLQRPSDLTTLPTSLTIDGVACGPFAAKPMHTLRISIFHDALPANIRKADWAMSRAEVLHPELIDAWTAFIPQLPVAVDESIRPTVLLDVTPAPGWMRAGGHVCELNALLLDDRTARIFMSWQVDGIADLVLRLHRHYAGNVDVKLTGALAVKSSQFVAGVVHRLLWNNGIRVHFVGEYVDPARAGLGMIRHAVQRLAPKKKTAEVEDWARAVRLAPLRKVEWSKKSVKLFDRACDGGSVEAVTDDLREVAELMVDERRTRLEMPPFGNAHRAMVHSVAQDMGLLTASEGEGENRYVVITKKSL
ncbi:hypothetical protein BFW01_g1519 [Lasiodiplodia theobromae]|nr:hypothetical protein BFW01_g1519 [Lasiodiplodia theobromae]